MSTPADPRHPAMFRRVGSAGGRVSLLGLGLCAALAFYILRWMPFAFADELVIPWWMFVPPLVLILGTVLLVVGRVGSWFTEYS